MKRILIILAILLPAAASAQNLSDVFSGDLVPRAKMVETYLQGSRLEPYHLTEFHSVKFSASESIQGKVAAAVMENADAAFEKETVYAAGKLVYAILVFHDSDSEEKKIPSSRFVCFQMVASEGSDPMITLVEMKGTARLEDLKSIFGSNENN